MKYKAVVFGDRNGYKLNLYVKFICIWIPIEFMRWRCSSIPDSCSFIITEKLEKWKEYYKDDLTIIDPRPEKIKKTESQRIIEKYNHENT
jgi:hypothetical protein